MEACDLLAFIQLLITPLVAIFKSHNSKGLRVCSIDTEHDL